MLRTPPEAHLVQSISADESGDIYSFHVQCTGLCIYARTATVVAMRMR